MNKKLFILFVVSSLFLIGASSKIPPGRFSSSFKPASAVRVQAAGVAAGTGTGVDTASAAPALGLVGAYYQTATAKTYVKDTRIEV